MIDFHSHCLPAMDDGATDVAQSAAMLTESLRQGVDTVVATPHFYRSEDKTVEAFLERRADSVALLKDQVPQGLRMVLGAEVLLQKGVSKLDLRPLCIEGTNRILIELPFSPPDPWVIEEMENIALGQRLDVILAHIDRYLPWYSADELSAIIDYPELIVQINGESIVDKSAYHALRHCLPPVDSLVFGSDMHDMNYRSPNLQAAYTVLRKKRHGRQWVNLADVTGKELLYNK